jgi:hypothetical protein
MARRPFSTIFFIPVAEEQAGGKTPEQPLRKGLN